MKILFVDDESLICLSFKMLIEKCTEHNVSCAFTVTEALMEIKAHPCDVLVTDYQLPDTTGIELVRQVREMGMNIPVIAISGYFTDEVKDELKGHGVDRYINKPFMIEELLRHLYDVFPESHG
ncbi:MAG: response regulator [Nitrospirales bacterium]|nr:response regulator [Nitrospirales bacterium]